MERPVFRFALQRLLSPRILRFAAVGFSGVFVNLGMLFIFADVLHVEDVVSSALAIEISIIWNFLLNNAWTFRDKNELARVGFHSRMLRYNLVSLVGLGIQLLTFIVLTNSIMHALRLEDAGVWKYPAQLVGIAIAMAWNFLSNFFWTWAQDDAEPVSAQPGPASELEQS